MKGWFLTFEGAEGSGKTTHAHRVAECLRRQGWEVVETREPGGTPIGEAIRHLLQHDPTGDHLAAEAECLLFAASRAQLVAQVIRPALLAGRCVVCDRFMDSTAAYQGYGRGLNLAAIRSIRDFAIGDVRPDLTVLLDVDPSVGLSRLQARSRRQGTLPDRLERETVAFHERVRRGYLEIAAAEPDRFRIVRVDRSIDEVHAEIWGHVAALLSARGQTGGHTDPSRPGDYR